MSDPITLRDAGMTAAENAADPRLKLMVDNLIAEAIASGEPFSANTIRDRMPVVGRGLVGARMNAMLNRRPCPVEWVGEEPSTLPSTHNKRIGRYVGVGASEQVAS